MLQRCCQKTLTRYKSNQTPVCFALPPVRLTLVRQCSIESVFGKIGFIDSPERASSEVYPGDMYVLISGRIGCVNTKSKLLPSPLGCASVHILCSVHQRRWKRRMSFMAHLYVGPVPDNRGGQSINQSESLLLPWPTLVREHTHTVYMTSL